MIPNRKDHTIGRFNPQAQLIWDYVSASPLHSLWDLKGASVRVILKRTFHAFNEDNLLSRAAELGFYFLFALFPTLVSVASILGLVARSASSIYIALLNYLALVIPHAAFNIVLDTFNQTSAAATSGKVTFGLVAALWSASVGFSAIQDTLNTVYKVKETRPYWKARGSAILVTLLLAIINTITLSTLLAGDFLTRVARAHIYHHFLRNSAIITLQTIAWIITIALVTLFFAVIYYFAPNVKASYWHWLTPGAAIGILGWIAASLILRVYLHFFDNYSLTYGSLGAVIILLTWFYITGLMLLLGAEINSEIEAAATEKCLHEAHRIAPEVTAEPGNHPVSPVV
ncbi:YihY/virulence factor BrkB family protein [Granulicella sp. dw_53]|uniref:YihY/virulence factor BrkB family protein n=1 Tax=Granulicella sp. dw_53 TaxID=2719792 RepID=UPI0031F7115A